jgi:hypothetical protein
MSSAVDPALVGLTAAGVVTGLGLLVRGLTGTRAAGPIRDTAPSRISGLAVGEVLVSGVAEPIELTLTSPLQSERCVYYRARITESRDDTGRELLDEERAIGFQIRDGSGTIRVFPRNARWDVPDAFDDASSALGGDPVGLRPRTGPAYAPGPETREAAIADLLTVHDSSDAGRPFTDGFASTIPLGTLDGRRRYREARIDVGATVTVTGLAVRFADIADPAAANLLDGSGVDAFDAEVALDIAEAREAGVLAATAADAWGNAAIPGFGIGRPTREPVLDPDATAPPPPDPTLAARVAATFDIAPDAVVLATTDELPLRIALGAPSDVTRRHGWQFVVGLAGAALAIASAMSLALVLDRVIR